MHVSSMTGFARIEAQQDGMSWVWEVRAVNGRGLDVRFRLPGFLSTMEEGLRKTARSVFTRGNLQINLQLSRLETDDAALDVDLNLARKIVEQFSPLVEEGLVTPPSVDGLLGVRGVLTSRLPDESPAGLPPVLRTSFEELLQQLLVARQVEGKAIFDNLSLILNQIQQQIELCRNNPALAPKAILSRLRSQIEVLGNSVPEERLAQEAALLAVKADVNEELDRLQSHVVAAHALLDGQGPIGRKLEFLSQELSREANTLCAKSNNQQLTEAGLALKTLIDQIKEQAANVE